MKRLLKALATSLKAQRMEILFYVVSIVFLAYWGPDVFQSFGAFGSMSYGQSGRFGSGYSGGGDFLAVLFSAVGFVYFTYTIPRDIIRSIRKQLNLTENL